MNICTDSIDTRTALEQVRELVTAANSYIANVRNAKRRPNRRLLENVALFITDLFKVNIILSHCFIGKEFVQSVFILMTRV